MTTTFTQVAKRPCGACGIPFPIGEVTNPIQLHCTSCRESMEKGMRSGQMLDQLWFERFWEMVVKLEKHRLRTRKSLTSSEYKTLDLFKQAMHRSRSSIDLPGNHGELSDSEWVIIAREKLKQYKRHLVSRDEHELIGLLITHAED